MTFLILEIGDYFTADDWRTFYLYSKKNTRLKKSIYLLKMCTLILVG